MCLQLLSDLVQQASDRHHTFNYGRRVQSLVNGDEGPNSLL